MPQAVVGAVAAGVVGGTTVTAAGVVTWGFSTAAFASSLALSAVSYAMAPRPQQQDMRQAGSRTQSVRAPVTNHRLVFGRVKIGGVVHFLHTADDDEGTEDGYLYTGHTLAACPCFQVEAIYLGEHLSTDTRYSDVVRLTAHMGADDQVADSDWVAEIPDKWTSAHRGRRRTWLAGRLKSDPSAFPQGRLVNQSAIIRGCSEIYDPRAGSTGYSTNPALVVAYLLTLPRRHGGMGVPWEWIDEPALVAAANICDEPVTLKAGGSESRYTCNGEILLDQDPVDNLAAVLSAMGGRAVFSGGRWYIWAAAGGAPTLTLTADDLRAGLTVRPTHGLREAADGVRGVFTWPTADWQPVDAPPVIRDGAGPDPTMVDLSLPMTDSPSMAQRLMHLEMRRRRPRDAVVFPAKLVGMAVRPGTLVEIDIDRYPWDGTVFRVVDWALAADGEGVDLLLEQEIDYSWDPDMEQDMPTPAGTNLPSGLVSPPDGITAEWEPGYERVRLSWTPVAVAALTGYDLQWRPSGETDWLSYGGTLSSAAAEIDTTAPADFRVRARSGRAGSDWLESLGPDAPDLVATGGVLSATLTWTAAGGDHLRIYRNGVYLGNIDDTGSQALNAEPAGTHIYTARRVNADGNTSATSDPSTTTVDPA